MARARTALVYVVPAYAIVVAWMRIEGPHRGVARAVLLAAIAVAPALAGPLRARLAVLAGTVLLGSWLALDASVATPLRLVTRLWDGTREFYDVNLPFDPTQHPHMQGAVLVAVFAFCLAVGLAVAARRPLLASLAVAVGAGWPGTLLQGGSELLLGGLILAAVLVILAGLRPRPGRRPELAFLFGAAVVAGALALVSSPTIAKGEFLHWQAWDLYTRPDRPVSVTYVWQSDYSGLDWPKKPTVLLKVKAPDRPLYWRATTLDAFIQDNWIEDLKTVFPPTRGGRADLSGDPLLPPAARRSAGWVKQEVTVEALEDRHLVGADEPVAYAPGRIRSVSYAAGGIALVVPGSDLGKTYTVWSYVRRPTPAQLARARPRYPGPITVDRGVYVPPFGAPGRDLAVQEEISAHTAPYVLLYRAAKRIVGRARNPYAAVVAIESWLRDSGVFRYDQHPPSVPGVPPLVAFVTRTHRGYCQHFAGAMALMLRYLGIPARVAAGFTSGKYDGDSGTWTVTDHDAHTWVEVWFDGYGWLPFDPTPGRGGLGASYTASSDNFDASAAAALVGGRAIQDLLQRRASLPGGLTRGEHARSIPIETGSGGNRGLRLLGLVLLVAAVGGFGIFLVKFVRRRSRYLTGDPRRIAAACRRELVEFLLDQRVEIPRSATLQELAQTMDAEFAVWPGAFVDAAGSARFGAPDAAAGAARRTRVELRELRRVLRGRLGALDRLAGALSLRSLRSA